MDRHIEVRDCRKHPIDNESDTIKHRQKRPRNKTNSVSATASTGRQTRSVTAAQQRQKLAIEKANNRTLSTIERLPVELLEKIFIYSLNVNFARSSPYLAAAVSNERVYRLLILLAFWDNDERYDCDYNPVWDEDVLGGNVARYENIGPFP